MQQFKSKFTDSNYTGTMSNIQSCLRLNDIDEIGDGSHLLYFNMIGLFSFRDWSVEKTIDYWMTFLNTINIIPDYVTIHPNKTDWGDFYKNYNVEVRIDENCEWSDGQIGGYCTEFYKSGIEIGNIVNPLGTCIDVGFGLERLEMILYGMQKTKEETLRDTVLKIINSGIKPAHNKQGYILKKLLRLCNKYDIQIEHQLYYDELDRQERMLIKYDRLKNRFKDRSNQWWWETHGIDVNYPPTA